ncbi:hypothetical protein [Neptunomonas concharum]|uniref:Uncharacterized protein n=1 Tax=Neptunomonas concharum TaxID=1031538 RepID=A0A5P1RA31_9GAMM|nr:hypothetical protein [Neptunomonas concharum]QEQ96468.1 hypothetical protein F0U83_06970 [Neptunomonas concharum]
MRVSWVGGKKLQKTLVVFSFLGISSFTSAESSVGIEQMKLASSVGASCSGFYDGVYRLLHNMEDEQGERLLELKQIWPGVNKRFVFRQSTSSMLMTDIFIRQLNHRFKPEPALSLQTFSDEYVGSRQKAMGWDNSMQANDTFLNQHKQCEHILKISRQNGTLTEERINGAMVQRANALGLDLTNM